MIHVRLASLNITIKFSGLFLFGLMFKEYISIKVSIYTKEKEKEKSISNIIKCVYVRLPAYIIKYEASPS